MNKIITVVLISILVGGCGTRAGSVKTYAEATSSGVALGTIAAYASNSGTLEGAAIGGALGIIAGYLADKKLGRASTQKRKIQQEIIEAKKVNRDLRSANLKLKEVNRDFQMRINSYLKGNRDLSGQRSALHSTLSDMDSQLTSGINSLRNGLIKLNNAISNSNDIEPGLLREVFALRHNTRVLLSEMMKLRRTTSYARSII